MATDWATVGLHVGVVALSAGIVGLVWRRRGRTGAKILLGVLGAIVLWNGGRALSAVTTGRQVSMAAMQADFSGAMLTTFFAFLFFVEFTGHEDRLTRRFLAAVAALPALDLLGIWTNPLHQQFFAELARDGGEIANYTYTLGPLYSVHLVFSYVLAGASIVLIVGKLIRARSIHRTQSFVLLLALLSPFVGHGLGVLGITTLFFAPSLGLMAVLIYLGFVDFRLLDVTPVARATVIDRLDIGVAVIDDDGQFIDINPRMREIFGLTADEQVVGTPVSDVLAAHPEFYERYRDVERTDEVVEIETADGPVAINVEIEPFEDRLRRRVGRIFLVQDVTERERRERELRRKNDQLEDLASVVSHDLRNPLQVASGNAEMLDDSDLTDRISDALTRMNVIIEDVLTLAREGNEIDDPEAVGLGAVADSAWEYVATAEATLDVRTDLAVEADEPRLQRLLENLFRNAIEHAGTDVTVRVGSLEGTRKSGGVASGPAGFYVADDGPGIPEDKRDTVFDAGHTTNPNGSGLGLSIVETIAQAHGWAAAVTAGDDGGARFEFTGVTAVEDVDSPERPDSATQRSEAGTD